MRRLIMERQSPDWLILRQQSKEVRRLETDTIQQFVECARSQGSTHANHYYSNLTKLANKAAGIGNFMSKRDEARIVQIKEVQLKEIYGPLKMVFKNPVYSKESVILKNKIVSENSLSILR